jgi:DNA-directed RNA polymerase specialized sigma24 family protein
MPANAIIENYADGLPADEIAEVFELPASSVHELLAYAVAHNPALKP